MESRVKFMGHPVHQQLVIFPLGLLATAVIFDVVYLASRMPEMAIVAYWLIAAGLIGAVVAAPFGALDWMKIPRGTRAKRIGALHGVGNLIVSLLFLASWLLRPAPPAGPEIVAMLFSFAGAALAVVTGWLGGELVDRLGVGVHEGAHLDAPSSLEQPELTPAQERRAASLHR